MPTIYRMQALAPHEGDAVWRRQRLQAWIEAWDSTPSLVEMFKRRLADDTPLDRYGAIDYMFYENLEVGFCTGLEDAYRLSALVLGEALVAHFGFQWCRSNMFEDEPLQVHHPEGDGGCILHLPAMVMHAQARGHMDVMDELFCDIFLHHLSTAMDDYHWLLALCREEWSAQQHAQRFDACPSRPLRKRIRLMASKDSEMLVRCLGSSGFLPSRAIIENDDWEQFELSINGLWKKFDEAFGADWSTRVVQEMQERKWLDV